MTTDNKTMNLEALLTGDTKGVKRDQLIRVLQELELELQEKLKQGCTQDEYKQVSVVANGARVAQVVLRDYHAHLNKS